MTDTIDDVLNRWTNAEEIRLRAGEIDRETMRTVLAVMNGMAREVRQASKEYENKMLGLLGAADAELYRLRKELKER